MQGAAPGGDGEGEAGKLQEALAGAEAAAAEAVAAAYLAEARDGVAGGSRG